MSFDYFPSRGASRASVKGKLNLWEVSSDLATAAGFAAAMNEAVRLLSLAVLAVPGGVIDIPPGDFTMGVPTAFAVATNEGDAVRLTAGCDNITFRGAGPHATTIRPVSNKVVMFSIVGGTETTFEGIHFDNGDNGLLQDQFKPTTQVAGGGIAGLGNAACSAIKQFTGGGLTVRHCEFTEFHTSIGYFGNQADTAVLVGDLIVDAVKFTGCVFGVLCQQPRTLSFTNFEFNNGENSLNDSGVPQTNDPGHALYFANRTGAYPESVVVTNGRGTNNRSSLVKVRKGNSVVISNIAVYASHRGVEAWNVKALTASNISVILADVDGSIDDDGLIDTNATGFELTDCGNYEVDNIFVNRSGANAWGVRIRSGTTGEAWQNLDGRIKGVTVKDDSSASTGKSFIYIAGQTDLDIVEPIARLTANVTHGKPVVEIDASTRVHVRRPKRRSAAASNPTGSDRLVALDASCVNCVVEYTREDMDVAPTANTVTDAGGTGLKVIRVDGEQSGTWIPTLAFATVGDSTITVNSSTCTWRRRGPNYTVTGTITFTTNAYTTAASSLQISGIPGVAVGTWRAPLSHHTAVVGTATDLAVIANSGDNFLQLRRNVMASAGATLTTANFVASTQFTLAFTITYASAET